MNKNSKCPLDCIVKGCGTSLCYRYKDYQQGRADERANVIKEFAENIIPTLYENNVDEEVINLCKKILEQMKGE